MKQTILITGASSGIGKATAILFQSKGWNVIATMRNPENETELNTIDNVLVTRLDVLDLESIQQAVHSGIQKFGKIDALLNNAGYGAFGPVEAFSRDSIVRQFNTNVIGLLDVTRAVLPHFRTNKNGVIVNISSVGGKVTFPLGALYHGTKFAVEGISEAMNFEVEQFGGKMKIVEPGAIQTDFTGRSIDVSADESMPEYDHIFQRLQEGIPAFFEHASPARVVADVVYEAVTDGTDQLRYTAGDDARETVNNRKQLDDKTFTEAIKSQFGL